MFLERVLASPLPGERIIFYLRRHWFIFAKEVVLYVLLLVLPLAAKIFLPYLLPGLWAFISSGGLINALVKLGLSLYYLGVWLFFWNAWVDYYLDVWLVTNERVVSLEQNGLFNRSVAELRLSRVQDVAASAKGLFSTMLGFGEVRIETAGEQSELNFLFHQVPKPFKVSERILRLADDWRHEHNADHPNGQSV